MCQFCLFFMIYYNVLTRIVLKIMVFKSLHHILIKILVFRRICNCIRLILELEN